MSKVFAVRTQTLRPEVNAEDYEKFVAEELNRVPGWPGWQWYILKGDKGDRVGKYLVIFEIDSVEARDRYAQTAAGEYTEEGKRWVEANPEAMRVWDKWGAFVEDSNFTDYVVVE